MAKHSIEKNAAKYHDAFLTVSDITAEECKYLLGKEVSHISFKNSELISDKTLNVFDLCILKRKLSSVASICKHSI